MQPKKSSKLTAVKSSINPVQRNIIHAENLKNEAKYTDRNINKQFQLNPLHTYVIAEKPTKIDPTKPKASLMSGKLQGTYTEDPVEEAFSNERLAKNLQIIDLVPRQKFTLPMTANQEIGWFNNQMGRTKSVQDHRIKSNEITKFANDYYELTRTSPFNTAKTKRSQLIKEVGIASSILFK